MRSSLSRQEVIKAVERKNPLHVPMVRAKWWGEGLEEQYGERLTELDAYPEDVAWLFIENPAAPERMNLSWEWQVEGAAHDSTCVIDDWAKLDEFIEKLPQPEHDEQLVGLLELAKNAQAEERYILFGWWRLFFEKPWSLRGMQNLMMDYYSAPEEVHRLHAALCDVYCRYIEYAGKHFRADGFWGSDDLGHQTGPMMSPKTFHQYLYPYYVKLGKALRENNMHFWLHSCGDNTKLLPDLIDAGLTVFHPVQKHTMNEKAVMDQFGDRLTFLAGLDVQHTLQENTPEEVREEVRFLMETFDRSEGGMCIAAGNGIVSGTPFENIRAFLDEAVRYGDTHRKQF
ncbi:MAG: methylcobamide--CoM methyltransferase [bacterium]|nr:methylcobamide--CoM methyltransferase [bacterium]